MRIVFLQENGYFESLGVMCLSAVLKQYGHTVDLLIASEEREMYDTIRKLRPELIAFSYTTDMHGWVIKTAGECKKRFKTPVIVGGAHPTCFPEIVEQKEIDIVCIGEGEEPIRQLTERLDQGSNYTGIKGLWVKKGKRIYKNSPAQLIKDFSAYPYPDRAIYYERYTFLKDMPLKRFFTGRGCPYNCAFCHNQILKTVLSGTGKYSRKIPVDRVIEEIKLVKGQYPMTTLHFSDDTFTLDKKWLFLFCRLYKKKISLPFSCNIRADLFDEEIAKRLRSAGCKAVSFGVESGSEKLRNKVLGKNITDKTIIRTGKLLKKYKVKFLTTNMFGIPEETEEDLYKTLEFNRKLRPDFTRAFIFDAFPKLPLTDLAINQGLLPPDYSLDDFTALDHEPITRDINSHVIKNLKSLFYVLVKVPIPIYLLRLLLRIPYSKIGYGIDRFSQAYAESRFFRVPPMAGLEYFFHIYKSFKSN